MLELKNISFARDNKQILNNINLKIDSNKFTVITGPNGSGMETPDSGKIFFEGKDITKLPINERANLGIGFAFQQPVRFKGLTVKDLIEISSGNSIKMNEACNYLADVGLCAKEYINRQIDSKLSGGELKRIEIAMLIAKNSKLTIFDEPEAGIDLWSFNNLINVFEKMKSTSENTILAISHQERILNIADEIIILKDGEIVDKSNSSNLKNILSNNSIHCKKI